MIVCKISKVLSLPICQQYRCLWCSFLLPTCHLPLFRYNYLQLTNDSLDAGHVTCSSLIGQDRVT